MQDKLGAYTTTYLEYPKIGTAHPLWQPGPMPGSPHDEKYFVLYPVQTFLSSSYAQSQFLPCLNLLLTLVLFVNLAYLFSVHSNRVGCNNKLPYITQY